MNLHYNQSYSREEIASMLKLVYECVECGMYSISRNVNRQENIDFINEYNIRSEKIESILNNLTVDDFYHTLQNTKVGYEDKKLYVFVPQVELFEADGVAIKVDIYIKINIMNTSKGNRMVVISFHKRKKPIQYAFR